MSSCCRLAPARTRAANLGFLREGTVFHHGQQTGRFAQDREDFIVFVCNFTPVPRHGYRVGVPKAGRYREILNTDAEMFGGSNLGNGGSVLADPIPFHGRLASLRVTLPPLAVVAFKL